MFFAPTILALLARKVDVHVLCMTSGVLPTTAVAGTRKHELRAVRFAALARAHMYAQACRRLGVPDAHVTIVEHTKISDGMTTKWSRPLISKILMTQIETYHIDTLLTFDRYGDATIAPFKI
jgi:N-acetylglucosaminylphosphatidylinositol deacetylase